MSSQVKDYSVGVLNMIGIQPLARHSVVLGFNTGHSNTSGSLRTCPHMTLTVDRNINLQILPLSDQVKFCVLLSTERAQTLQVV